MHTSEQEIKEMTPDEKKFAIDFLKLKIQMRLSDLLVLIEQYKDQAEKLNRLLINHPSIRIPNQNQMIDLINSTVLQYEADIKQLIDEVTPAITLTDIHYYDKRCQALLNSLERTLGQALEGFSKALNHYVLALIANDPIESRQTVSTKE